MSNFWSEFVLLFNTNPRLVTLLWTVISFGLGTGLGHWYAKRRDKRKEFNAVADELFLALDAFRDGCRDGEREMPKIGRDDFRKLRPHLNWYEARKYQAAVDNFLSNLEANADHIGVQFIPVLKNPATMLSHLDRLIKLLRHR